MRLQQLQLALLGWVLSPISILELHQTEVVIPPKKIIAS